MKNYSSILLSILVFTLILGCIEGGPVDVSVSPKTTQPAVICNKPYIRVGADCCLDKDDNGVCDNDEKTTTKPLQQETATTSTTITSSTDAMCASNSDCGDPDEVIVCANEDVVKLTITYECVRPGMVSAECIGTSKAETLDECDSGEICFYGVCVDDGVTEDYSTTTLPHETTTTTVEGPPATVVEATTTTSGPGSMGETTTTTMAPHPLPCTLMKSWSPSQCAARSCSLGKTCVFQPNINPALPGACACKSFSVTTTTLMVPHLCSGFPAFTQSSCTGRGCPIGKYCAYKSPSGGFPWGTCSCKPTTTTLGFAPMTIPVKLSTTTSTTLWLPQVSIPVKIQTTTTTTTLMGLTPITVFKLPTTTTTLAMVPMPIAPVKVPIQPIMP